MEFFALYGTKLYRAVNAHFSNPTDLMDIQNYLGEDTVRNIILAYLDDNGEVETYDLFELVFANRTEEEKFNLIVKEIVDELQKRVMKKWMDGMTQEQAQMIRDLVGDENKIIFNGFEFEAKEIPSLWKKAHEKIECI